MTEGASLIKIAFNEIFVFIFIDIFHIAMYD